MLVILRSTKTKLISKNLILQICKLKDSHWKKGISSQLKFYKINCKPNDINNLMYHNKKLIGYTLLRRRKYLINNSKKNCLYFDTLVIDKKLRNFGFSHFLMNFNNSIIKKSKLPCFLVCEDKLIKFYKKFEWKIRNKKNIRIKNYKKEKNYLSFNYHQKNKKGIVLEI